MVSGHSLELHSGLHVDQGANLRVVAKSCDEIGYHGFSVYFHRSGDSMNGLVILMSHLKHPLPCCLPALENAAI
jgi:hypothetical protein